MAPSKAAKRGPATDSEAAVAASSDPLAAGALSDAEEALHERTAKAGAAHEVVHLTVSERQRQGRVARAMVPREELGPWAPTADRPDPVELLVGQEESRVPALVPVRHARMAASAFAFYRGAALVMASDLATSPRSGLDVQLCGDAHLSNFGMFAAPDRSVIFDVNDFDETNPGPFEWDVKRLAASFVLAARDNHLPVDVGRAAARTAAESYRTSMADYAQMPELSIWYDRVDATGVVAALQQGLTEQDPKKTKKSKKGKGKSLATEDAEAQQAVGRALAKAQSRDAWSAIEKLTEVVDGQRQFRNQPPLLVRPDLGPGGFELLNTLFRQYRATLQDDRRELLKRYRIIDFGHKVVGVGSVGLLAFVMLMQGKDENDLMVLQVKQAQASVLEAFTSKSPYSKHGHRVVTGQRLMQAASDSFLGWIDGPAKRSFYVRQLRDMKWSPEPSALDARKLSAFAALCGHTLARAHARTGDAVAIAAYLGSGRVFDKAIAQFAVAYADTAAADFALFTAAIADGRLAAHEGADGDESQTAFNLMVAEASQAGRSRRRAARVTPPATTD